MISCYIWIDLCQVFVATHAELRLWVHFIQFTSGGQLVHINAENDVEVRKCSSKLLIMVSDPRHGFALLSFSC